ncbi:LPS export ABC transporter permease LptG [Sphingomonas sp.]|uniref:LPS export ABC transporter permease LptG n=1 Tax=Sphingomonas sp. TaxID=28214 RepID=UPI002FDB3563
MSLRGLFPSPTISLYMARLFVFRTFALLGALVLVLTSLDLLTESAAILAHPGNGNAEILRYVTLRVPQIVSTFLPYSVLGGAIFTLAQLNQNSEIVALKSGGLSAHQVLAPLMISGLIVAGLSFAFNDRIVSRATATLEQWKKVEFAPLPVDRGDRANVWVQASGNLINVQQIKGKGEAAQLYDITVYQRTRGSLTAILTAKHGVRAGDGWRVDGVKRFDIAAGTLTPVGPTMIGAGVRPDQFTLAHVDPDSSSFSELRLAIDELKAAGRPTKALEGSLWHKLSGPLSALLMPLLGGVSAFGLARSGKLFVRVVIGMALGFLYFVADNFALAMGNLGAYPPFLAAWAPFLLFLMIGEAVLLRTEE